MLSSHSVGTHHGNELTHNSPGNVLPQSFQSADHYGLILAEEWNWCMQADLHLKKHKWGMIIKHSRKILACEKKAIIVICSTK